jgi:hypothetical protein
LLIIVPVAAAALLIIVPVAAAALLIIVPLGVGALLLGAVAPAALAPVLLVVDNVTTLLSITP